MFNKKDIVKIREEFQHNSGLSEMWDSRHLIVSDTYEHYGTLFVKARYKSSYVEIKGEYLRPVSAPLNSKKAVVAKGEPVRVISHSSGHLNFREATVVKFPKDGGIVVEMSGTHIWLSEGQYESGVVVNSKPAIECNESLLSSYDEGPIFDIIFWLYNPSTKLGLVATKYQDQIMVAVKDAPSFSSRYYVDFANPTVIKPEVIAKFIALKRTEGYQVIINEASQEFTAIGQLSEHDLKTKISLAMWYGGAINQYMVSFVVVNKTLATNNSKTQEILKWAENIYNTADTKIPDDAKHLSREEVVKKVNLIITKIGATGVERIRYPFMSFYSQSLRGALHFAVNKADLELLNHLNQHFHLSDLEPLTLYLVSKLMMAKLEIKSEVQQWFLDNSNYESLPWTQEDLAGGVLQHLVNKVNEIKSDINTELGLKFFERYFQENPPQILPRAI